MKVMRAAVYTRVSTEDQVREGYSLDAQQRACGEYATRQAWQVVGHYVDDGYSGRSLERPALKRLLEDIHAHRIDVIVVWKIDRLSRRLRHLLDLYETRIEPEGVGLAAVTQNVDTTTPAGKAMLQVLGVFGELDWATMRERVSLGRAEAARKGLSSGRTFGYRITGPGRREVDEDEAAVYRRILELFWRGHGIEMIAALLTRDGIQTPQYGVVTHGHRVSSGKWSGATVLRILKNPFYAGFTIYRGEKFPGQHPPLISVEEWERVQTEIHSRHKTYWRPDNGTFLLSGLAVCGLCGSRLYGTHKKVKRTGWQGDYYCCSRRMRLRAEDRLNNATCALPLLRLEKYEPAVLAAIHGLMLDPQALRASIHTQLEAEAQQVSDSTRLRESMESELAVVREKLANLVRVASTGQLEQVEEFASAVRTLNERKETLQVAISKTPPPPDRSEVLQGYLALAADFPAVWDEATFDERRQLLRALVRRVVMYPEPGHVELELRLG